LKRKYLQEYDIAPPITFGGDHVALDISDDGTETSNGWRIVPLHRTKVRVINHFLCIVPCKTGKQLGCKLLGSESLPI